MNGIPVIFTLKVDEQQLNIINEGLVNLPYKVASPVIAACQVQINEQIAAMGAKTAEKEGEDKDEEDRSDTADDSEHTAE